MTKLDLFLKALKFNQKFQGLEVNQVKQGEYRIYDNYSAQPPFLRCEIVTLADSLGLMNYFDYDQERKKVYFQVYN